MMGPYAVANETQARGGKTGTLFAKRCCKPLSKEPEMSLESLSDLFVHELRDVLDAEKQILKALPKMAKSAASEELKSAFEEHREVTEQQVKRLEQIFKELGKPVRAKKCLTITGL